MNKKSLASVLAAGFLATGIGIAHADGLHIASTPGRAHVVTPRVVTPTEQVGVSVQPIPLPLAGDVRLGGVVATTVSTPAATPEISAVPEIPSVEVAEIPVEIDLPVTATVGTDGIDVHVGLGA